jgi:hypothetical protein
MDFKKGTAIYFTSDLMRDFFLGHISDYKTIMGIPLEFSDSEVEKAVNEILPFVKNGEVLDNEALIKATPLTIKTDGLINIPTKYQTYYNQAKVIAGYLSALPFFGKVSVDLVIGVLDKLVDMGVFEFSDAPRDEFVVWLKGKI